MNHRSLILVGAAYSTLACVGEGDTPAREKAAGLVREALQAELAATACNDSVASIDTLPNAFFPSVVLLRGLCSLEHGGTIARVAGIDSDGIVYTLDSPGAFRWLLARHTPKNLDSRHMVAYAHLALTLTGRVDAGARLINGVGDLPAHVSSALAPRVAENLPKSEVRIEPDVADVFLTTYDGQRLIAHTMIVSLPKGTALFMQTVVWTARPD